VVEAFLRAFAEWAWLQDDIAALALVGSYAHDSARLNSDVDLVILADDPKWRKARSSMAAEERVRGFGTETPWL
jgi:predicted nucleotidyltransferase